MSDLKKDQAEVRLRDVLRVGADSAKSGPLIKVCGLTDLENALMVSRLCVDMLGFIFHKQSPRNVSPSFPAMLTPPGVRKVGVFVRQSPEETARIMARGRLDLAQLHGGQDVEFCKRVGAERVIRVFWPERHAGCGDPRGALEEEMAAFADAAAFFLLDAGKAGGGHGTALDFTALENLKSPRPLLLAGGLGPDNAARAFFMHTEGGFAGFDLNSGVESAPGIKDKDKLEETLLLLKP